MRARWTLLFLAVWLASAATVLAQGGISGQVVTTIGHPAANAPIRVCPNSGTGSPCTPLAAIYSDPDLLHPLPNPATTDAYGNYSLFAAAGTYIVQIAPQQDVTYNYLVKLGTGAGSAAVFPTSPGLVFGLSPSSSRTATIADILALGVLSNDTTGNAATSTLATTAQLAIKANALSTAPTPCGLDVNGRQQVVSGMAANGTLTCITPPTAATTPGSQQLIFGKNSAATASNLVTDAAGNNLIVPGALTANSASVGGSAVCTLNGTNCPPSSGSGGITQLTTDVTTATGSGAQAATVVGLNGVPLTSLPGVLAVSSASVNIYNPATATEGTVVNSNTGVVTSSSGGTSFTGFSSVVMDLGSVTTVATPIATNFTYWGSYNSLPAGVAFLNASGTYISGIENANAQYIGWAAGSPITAPVGTRYVAAWYKDSLATPSTIMVCVTACPSTYVAYASGGTPRSATQADVALVGPLSNSINAPTGSVAAQVINARLNAQFFQTNGNNGAYNALQSTGCTSGASCTIFFPGGYTNADSNVYGSGRASMWVGSSYHNVHFVDDRNGYEEHTTWNPLNQILPAGYYAGTHLRTIWTYSMATNFGATGNAGNGLSTFVSDAYGYDGGSNQETAPFYKSNYLANQFNAVYNTSGQHQLMGGTISSFGAGDVLFGSRFVHCHGGYKSSSDEGCHLYDTQVTPSVNSPLGTLSAGAGTGSQNIALSNVQDGAEFGAGLYVGDMTKAISPSMMITGATFDNTTSTLMVVGVDVSSLPTGVSVEVAGAISAGSGNSPPGTTAVTIATTGLPSTGGFASTTSGLSAGNACIWDMVEYGPTQENFEIAPISITDSTHLTVVFAKRHYGPFAISQGGGCGYGLEMEADRRPVGGNTDVLNVTPILAGVSSSSVRVDYNAHAFGIPGSGGYSIANCGIASITSNGSVATVTANYQNNNTCSDLGGKTATLSGNVSDLMGSHLLTATTVGGLVYTFPVTTGSTESGSSGGNIAFNNGNYKLIPLAEVRSPFNATTNLVDGGTLTLAPNTIAFATGDTIEQFNLWSQKTMDAEEIQQAEVIPGADSPANGGGVVFAAFPNSIVSRGQVALHFRNAQADSLTAGLGTGGTHQALNWWIKAEGAAKEFADIEYMPGQNVLVYHPLHRSSAYLTTHSLYVEDELTAGYFPTQYTPGSHTTTFPGPIQVGTSLVCTSANSATTAGCGTGSTSGGSVPAAYGSTTAPTVGQFASSDANGVYQPTTVPTEHDGTFTVGASSTYTTTASTVSCTLSNQAGHLFSYVYSIASGVLTLTSPDPNNPVGTSGDVLDYRCSLK